MKKAIFYLSVIICCMHIHGCSKSNDVTSTSSDSTTSLSITAADGQGNKLTGAVITLYGSEADWLTKTNPIRSGISGTDGTCFFDSLSPKPYFWSASMDCMSNLNGIHVSRFAVTEHARNCNTATLYGTGSLTIVNTSSYVCSYFINYIFSGNLQPKTSVTISDVAVGIETIRLLQITGDLSDSSEKTYHVTLSCGEAKVISYK